MAWAIKDEWIDPVLSRHYVIFHNPDVLVEDPETGQKTPREHHLVHDFKMWACAHCGRPHGEDEGRQPVDFEGWKKAALAALHAEHRRTLDETEKHPRARIGSGPRK